MKKFLLILSLISSTLCVSGARIDTVQVFSPSMQKNVDIVAVIPDKAVKGESSPVIYLLHGHGNNHFCWINIKPDLGKIADREGVIFVTPDGKDSWYWNCPIKPEFKYETFISDELVAYMDANYPTIKDRKARAITGLSMGGHGAMWNGIRHPEVFASVGSTSGGVDIRPFPESWNMKTKLGELKSNPEIWKNHTVTTLADTLSNGLLALVIDCGYEDFFFEVNNQLHEKLLKRGVEHDYLVRPGGHDRKYWNNSIDYQILFFVKQFRKAGY